MAELFRNKFRIPSARLQTWNYANEGMYYITICTKDREPFLGEIKNGEMHLSEIGKVAQTAWESTLKIRPDMNLELGTFQVMPNHIHCIILIGGNPFNLNRTDVKNSFAPQSKNLASILRGYKSSVTTSARQKGLAFGWQTRFHDHIIRSAEDYERISEYIQNNPYRWAEDEFYVVNPYLKPADNT